jgi:hypothetical protein
MKSQFRLAVCFALFFLTSGQLLQAEDVAGGWKELMTGSDLSEHWTTKGSWSFADGVATLKPRPGEKGWQRYDAYLWLEGDYKDFEIDFEYKLEPKGNSGFYFHVGDIKKPVETGIEVQIYDSHGKPADAKLTDHDSGGIIPGLPPSKNTAKPAGEWNRFQITAQGDRLTVKLNGETVNVVDLNNEKLKSRPKSGAIGFQDHGLPMALRKVRIRKL